MNKKAIAIQIEEMEAEKFGSGRSYYSILGVGSDCSPEEIRRAYRRLAMRWHPDRCRRTAVAPSLLSEAKVKFQQIQQAYSVLSDPMKRAMYDAGLYNHDDDEHNEAFYDFMQELVSLMAKVKSEDCKCDSMEELKTMFMEMAQGF